MQKGRGFNQESLEIAQKTKSQNDTKATKSALKRENALLRTTLNDYQIKYQKIKKELKNKKKANLEYRFYEFEKDFFSNAIFEGKTIPCISLKGQKIFHSGYELRDKDKQDIAVLESISK